MIYIVCLIVVFGVLAVDLVSKYLVAQARINAVIIPELVKFVYTTNTGSAFSFLGDRRWAMPMFIILTFIVLFIILRLRCTA